MPTVDTRNALVEFYLPLAVDAARVFRRRNRVAQNNYQLDELAAVATLGLIQAVERFDPELSRDCGRARFEPFAYRRLIGAMWDELRRANIGRRAGRLALSLEALAEGGASPTALLDRGGPDPGSEVCGSVDCRTVALTEAFVALSPVEEAVIRMVDYRRVPLAVVGEWWGVSESRVSKIHKRAVGRLRATMARSLQAA